jgi:hypothetical protein
MSNQTPRTPCSGGEAVLAGRGSDAARRECGLLPVGEATVCYLARDTSRAPGTAFAFVGHRALLLLLSCVLLLLVPKSGPFL